MERIRFRRHIFDGLLVSPFGEGSAINTAIKILLITGTGIGTSILLMSLVSSVYELFLRMAMGLVTGFIPTSLAMISAQTPKNGWQSARHAADGHGLGRIIRPLARRSARRSRRFYIYVFITSFAIYSAVFLVFAGVRERPLKQKRDASAGYTRKQVLQTILHQRPLITAMILTAVIQVGNFSVQPLLALYVSELHGTQNLAFFRAGFFCNRPWKPARCEKMGRFGRPVRPRKNIDDSRAGCRGLRYPARTYISV